MRRNATATAARVAKMQRKRGRALTDPGHSGTVEDMKLSISSDIALDSGGDAGFVTWFDVRAYAGAAPQGEARVALVHIGEIADSHGDIWRALRASKLESVHDAYFEQGWYKDEYADGAGIDLLYVQDLAIDARLRPRNLDLAIVRRLCDTIASGCQLVVMPYTNAEEAAHWARLGFEIGTPGRSHGLLHMKLGVRHARVVDTTGNGHFEVLGAELSTPTARRVGFGFQS